MEANLKIVNCRLVTMDSQNTIYKRGFIAIDGEKIVTMGDMSQSGEICAHEEIDACEKIVMPGLINTHSHAPMSIYRGIADDLPLQEWLNDHIFPIEAQFTNICNVEIGAKLSIVEMIKSGTTTFADMYYFEHRIAEICREMGIRAMLSEAILDFPTPDFTSPDQSFAYCEELIQQYKDDPLVQIQIGPHAPYTCSDKTLMRARKIANRYNTTCHIHLSETENERATSISSLGKSPVEHLEEIGFLEGKTLAAHCVKVSSNDIEILYKNGVGVSHNISSNLKLSSGISPINEMLKRGLKPSLGTDSAASNNNLDMFGEMKMAALVHKATCNDPTVLDAKTILQMATINGARCVDKESQIGSLEVGKLADLIVVDTHQAHMQPMYNEQSQLVYAAQGNDVEMVIINGKVVMKNRQLTMIDEKKILKEVEQLSQKIVEQRNQPK